MADFMRILSQVEVGDALATEHLLPVVYEELRKLAAAKLAQESPGQTLQATALVHEAYLRLVSDAKPGSWDGQGHFFAAAAEAMRRILVENARRKKRQKHGGEYHRQPLDKATEIAHPMRSDELIALDEALNKLESTDPQTAELVKLRFFAGFSMPQVAEALGRPLRTVTREWTFARVWLYRELSFDDTSLD